MVDGWNEPLWLIWTPGIWELLLIFGIALLIFGSSKISGIGKGLGEGIRNFKTGLKGEESGKLDSDKNDKLD